VVPEKERLLCTAPGSRLSTPLPAWRRGVVTQNRFFGLNAYRPPVGRIDCLMQGKVRSIDGGHRAQAPLQAVPYNAWVNDTKQESWGGGVMGPSVIASAVFRVSTV